MTNQTEIAETPEAIKEYATRIITDDVDVKVENGELVFGEHPWYRPTEECAEWMLNHKEAMIAAITGSEEVTAEEKDAPESLPVETPAAITEAEIAEYVELAVVAGKAEALYTKLLDSDVDSLVEVITARDAMWAAQEALTAHSERSA